MSLRAVGLAVAFSTLAFAGCLGAPEEAVGCERPDAVVLTYDERLDRLRFREMVQLMGWDWTNVGEDGALISPPLREVEGTVGFGDSQTVVRMVESEPGSELPLETHTELLISYVARTFDVEPAETERVVLDECF